METQVKQYKSRGETMYTGTIQSQVSLQMLDLKWQKKNRISTVRRIQRV